MKDVLGESSRQKNRLCKDLEMGESTVGEGWWDHIGDASRGAHKFRPGLSKLLQHTGSKYFGVCRTRVCQNCSTLPL